MSNPFVAAGDEEARALGACHLVLAVSQLHADRALHVRALAEEVMEDGLVVVRELERLRGSR